MEQDYQTTYDLNLSGSSITDNILSNPLELFLQEIELSVKMSPNEIYGIKESLNLNRYLFNRYVTTTQIRNEISTFISRNCEHAKDYNYNVDCELLKDPSGKDVIYIVVRILAPDETGEIKEYLSKFLLGT